MALKCESKGIEFWKWWALNYDSDVIDSTVTSLNYDSDGIELWQWSHCLLYESILIKSEIICTSDICTSVFCYSTQGIKGAFIHCAVLFCAIFVDFPNSGRLLTFNNF